MTEVPIADPQTPSQPTVDPSALVRLERFGGKKLLRELVALFQVAAPERVSAARLAALSGDVSGAELALHSLKSSAAQLGATRLSRLSEEGEVLTRAGTLEGVDEIIRELSDELVRVQEWLRKSLDGEAT
jgi:HPt (histidine-containing phosphotransfer) domain-containing protein